MDGKEYTRRPGNASSTARPGDGGPPPRVRTRRRCAPRLAVFLSHRWFGTPKAAFRTAIDEILYEEWRYLTHEMASFRRAGDERVNVFEVDELYLFKHYFDSDEVFDRLKQYYNNQHYRFEVPPDDFEALRSFLGEHGYGLVVVSAIDEFVVVVEKYTSHPENIFKQSVMQRSVDGHNCFLMTDQAAVEQAVHDGATRLTETELSTPF